MDRILLVDDDIDVLSGYQRVLRKDFSITTAIDGEEALETIRMNPPFAVVVSDYSMRKMNGIELLSIVKKISPNSVRMIVTGYANLETSINAVNEGNVFRFLTKPVGGDILIKVLKDCVEHYNLITAEKDLLEKTLKGTIKVLVDMLNLANPHLASFSSQIRGVVRELANQLQMKNAWEAEIAALLSTIGCITVPEEIMEKVYKHQDLSQLEAQIFSKHPSLGAEIVKNIPRLANIAEGIKFQSLNFDGSNAHTNDPQGADIPLIARLIKVAQDFVVYINMGHSINDVLATMKGNSYIYDPQIFTSLLVCKNFSGRGYVTKSIPFRQLRIGMILEEDLQDETQFVLIRKGQEVTDVMLLRLINMSKYKKFVEPIRVKEFIANE